MCWDVTPLRASFLSVPTYLQQVLSCLLPCAYLSDYCHSPPRQGLGLDTKLVGLGVHLAHKVVGGILGACESLQCPSSILMPEGAPLSSKCFLKTIAC